MDEASNKEARAADLLQDFVDSQQKACISMEDFIETLGGRAFGLAMLILALANLLIANVPGISTVLGLPIVLLSLQIVVGRRDFWVPARLRRAEIKKSTLESMVSRARSILKYLEKFIRPRMTFLIDERAQRWIGLCCLILGIVLMLPILFGNFLPAWALAFISLGLIEKDGLFTLIGMVIGTAATAYAIAFFVGGASIIYGIF